MSITGMRTKMHKNILAAILIIGGLTIMLPVFFSGFGGASRRRNPQDEQQSQYSQVVARVGSQEITRGELETAIDNMANNPMMGRQNLSALQRHQMAPNVLSNLEDQAILVEAARKQGVEVNGRDVDREIDKLVKSQSDQAGVNQVSDPSERARYEAQIRAQVESDRPQIENSLLIQKLVDQMRKKVTSTKDSDYQVNARHILISWKGLPSADKKVTRTKAEAKALADKLAQEARANPSGFAALADKNTEDASGKGRGGDLGWFSKGQMVPAFDAAVFKAKPGDIVGPIETQFGYHIIKVEDRRISDARMNEELRKLIDAEKKNTKIEVLAPDLKAAEAYQSFMTASTGKDKKTQDAKRKDVIAAYEAAAKARPNDPAMFAMLGQLYRDSGNTQKAIEAYEAAAALPPASADIHLALGDLYRQTKQKDKAIDAYKVAGRLAGGDTMTHAMLRMAYHDMGEKELAKQQDEWMKNAQPQGQGQPMTIPGG